MEPGDNHGELIEWREVDKPVSYTEAIRANSETFFKALELLMQATESDDSTKMAEAILDVISRRGLTEVARMAWTSVQPVGEIFVPANPQDVRHYLITVYSMPRIKIADIGSVDEELVSDLGLQEFTYPEQINELLTFVVGVLNRDHISVLELPEIQGKFREIEKSGLKKLITEAVIEAHGIARVFDPENNESWRENYTLVEQLSTEACREYSRYLRHRRHQKKERLPLRDVQDDLNDILGVRDKAIQLAISNLDASGKEVERSLELKNNNTKDAIKEFLDRIKEDREDGEE